MKGGRVACLLAALAALAGVLALSAAEASAHAVVERTEPARGATLDRAPDRVTVVFDEPVESSFGALRVFAFDGERVDTGKPLRPSSDAISVRLRDDLPDGRYTATYRVVSADAHPVSGGYVFTVGNPGRERAAAVAVLLEQDAGPVTDAAFGVARAAAYAATALLAGGYAFLLLAWLPALRALGAGHSRAPVAAGDGSAGGWPTAVAAFERRGGAILLAAAVGGMIASGAGIVLQGATVIGASFWTALDADLLQDVLGTRFGDVWKLRFTAFGVLAALLAFAPPLGRRSGSSPRSPVGAASAAAIALALAYLLVSPALAGHAGAGEDSALLVPLDALHVAAMSAWIGGVALLVLAVPVATRLLAPEERTRLLAMLVARFSTIALIAVVALLASGILQSVIHLDRLGDLLDTAFGRAILVKAAIFLALIALGAHNRRRSQPRLARLAREGSSTGRDGLLLRRALRAELALMVAVLGVSAALVSYSPSADERPGPYSGSVDLGPARLELTVDPAAAGRNEVHIYLFDATTGAQYDRPRRMSLSASERDRDIGPIAVPLRKAGPGHYTATGAALAPAGDWTLRVRARVSQFEELRGELEVPIR